jgi:hypothetical protein
MDFEFMVALKFLTSPKTAQELRRSVGKFYDSPEPMQSVGGLLLKMEQARLISKSGLPAKYVATTAGAAMCEQFELGMARYRSVFSGITAES